MANRRMFSLKIVDSDAFMDMSQTAQLLYFHLAMRADDDGFIGNTKKIMRMIGSSEDDLKVLLLKRFLLIFESGVIVVKHWRMHNYIQNDRYCETQYLEEKSSLSIKDNGAYTDRIQDVSILDTKDRLGKDRIELGKVRERGTPSQEAQEFFEKGPTFDGIRELLIQRIPVEAVDRELEKFISYWTEPNKSGSKVRWQLQKTFDVKRRLHTWFDRVQSFQKVTRGKGLI